MNIQQNSWKYYNITNDNSLAFNFRYHLLYRKAGKKYLPISAPQIQHTHLMVPLPKKNL